MENNDMDKTIEKTHEEPKGHSGLITILVAGLVIALAGDGYLVVRSNHVNDQLASMEESTQGQISKLGDSTKTLVEQRLETINAQLQEANTAANAELKKARSEAFRQSTQLGKRLDEEQQQVVGQLTELKDATTSANSKLNEVSTDVTGVKTDVSGVKTEVNTVKTDLASAQSDLAKHTADLKTVMGDMGVMSGLIATNGKDLAALRELGERNYIEFDLKKGELTKKVADVTLTLKKADPKRNRFTMNVLADDKRVEKRDKTINEPVQVYVSDSRQPYEIVINQVKKDEIVGYVATPKVKIARR